MKNIATAYLNTQIETLLTNATVAHVEQRTDDRDSRIADALELIEAVAKLEGEDYTQWIERMRVAATSDFTAPLPADPLRGEWGTVHQSDGTVRPAGPKEYRPLTFGDTIQEGDEVWADNMGPWTPLMPSAYWQGYHKGCYAMRRPVTPKQEYRDLVVGEVIQEGDEMFEYNRGPWSPVLRNNIGRTYHEGYVKTRRPIHLDTAPAAEQTPGA